MTGTFRYEDGFIKTVACPTACLMNCPSSLLAALMPRTTTRFDAFSDDSQHGLSVAIQFDNDNTRFDFPTSDLNGLIETTITLPAAKAGALLTQHNSRDWLMFNVVSEGHQGKGKIALIGPTGVSVVSDIDSCSDIRKGNLFW